MIIVFLGEIGEFEHENFNAYQAVVEVEGKQVHPGSAKGLMCNASLVLSEFISRLPEAKRPSTTEVFFNY